MVWAWILLFVAAGGAFLAGKSLVSSVGATTSNLLSNPILWGLGLVALWLLMRRGSAGSGPTTTNVIIKNTDDDTYLRRRWR